MKRFFSTPTALLPTVNKSYIQVAYSGRVPNGPAIIISISDLILKKPRSEFIAYRQ
jgi:hypothetical protein